jgi:monoterpene epsilon-lactone hydrolase
MAKTNRHPLTAADQKAMKARRAAIAANPISMTRELFDQLMEHGPPAEDVKYTNATVGDVSGVWCTPARPTSEAAILYLHGGAYVMGSAHAFRQFVGHISSRTGIAAFIPDYRLAPEHPFPAAVDDVFASYRWLTGRFGTERVAVVGDSAGGGLTLACLQAAKSAACGVLLSPWIDLALTGASLTSKAAEDPILTHAALERAAHQYLRQQGLKEPLASPLYGPLEDIPAIQIHLGTAEILIDD